jgi:hypothetical protein
MASKDVKIQLFEIASRIVAPIVAAAASKITVAVDPSVQDAQLRQLNLFAFEETQVIYNGLKLAFEDNTTWPDPNVSSPAVVANPVPSTPIPAPGSALANAAQIAGTVASVASAVAGAIH